MRATSIPHYVKIIKQNSRLRCPRSSRKHTFFSKLYFSLFLIPVLNRELASRCCESSEGKRPKILIVLICIMHCVAKLQARHEVPLSHHRCFSFCQRNGAWRFGGSIRFRFRLHQGYRVLVPEDWKYARFQRKKGEIICGCDPERCSSRMNMNDMVTKKTRRNPMWICSSETISGRERFSVGADESQGSNPPTHCRNSIKCSESRGCPRDSLYVIPAASH